MSSAPTHVKVEVWGGPQDGEVFTVPWPPPVVHYRYEDGRAIMSPPADDTPYTIYRLCTVHRPERGSSKMIYRFVSEFSW